MQTQVSGIIQRQELKADSVDKLVNEFARVVDVMREVGFTGKGFRGLMQRQGLLCLHEFHIFFWRCGH